MGAMRSITDVPQNVHHLIHLCYLQSHTVLKIIFRQVSVILTGQTNLSSVTSCFWLIEILKILIIFETNSLLSKKYYFRCSK